jgi:hypothetical protein
LNSGELDVRTEPSHTINDLAPKVLIGKETDRRHLFKSPVSVRSQTGNELGVLRVTPGLKFSPALLLLRKITVNLFPIACIVVECSFDLVEGERREVTHYLFRRLAALMPNDYRVEGDATVCYAVAAFWCSRYRLGKNCRHWSDLTNIIGPQERRVNR